MGIFSTFFGSEDRKGWAKVDVYTADGMKKGLQERWTKAVTYHKKEGEIKSAEDEKRIFINFCTKHCIADPSITIRPHKMDDYKFGIAEIITNYYGKKDMNELFEKLSTHVVQETIKWREWDENSL